MDDNFQLTDILLRRFENRFYDSKADKILHEAFSLSTDDRNSGYRLSANCLRILIEDMNVDPIIYTLAEKSSDEYSILSINIESIVSCETPTGNLTVMLDPVDDNISHCLICGYPYDAGPKIRKDIRRVLANKSSLFENYM